MLCPETSHKHLLRFIISCCCLLLSALSQAQLITTISGNGTAAFTGDGGLAKSAQVGAPLAICIDGSGNIYFTDLGNQRVRRIDALTGIITTIAGNGTVGFSGDGGPAINAQLNNPFRICLDKSNNLYFSDYNNFRIRKVNLTTGIISTLAGDGTQNYVSGALAANTGMLPCGLVFDAAGNLYLSQRMGPLLTTTTNIISKLDMTTGIVTTIAGTGIFGFSGDGGPAMNAQFNHPTSLSMDAAGNLYIGDQNNNRVRKITMATGIITTVAGDGLFTFNQPDGIPALNYSFHNLTDIYINAAGNLLITDENKLKVQEINLSTGLITTLAGNGSLGMGMDCVDPKTVTLGDCSSVVQDIAGNTYFTDLTFPRLRKIIKATNLNPQIQIAASADTICAGASVTFTSTVLQAGIGPTYQWMINGGNAGANSPSFTTANLNDKDIVTCKLTAAPGTGECAIGNTGYSNAVKITVPANIQPVVVISSSAAQICAGTSVTFTANANNAGINPLYQWTINGVQTGNGTDHFSTTILKDNDLVQCLVTIAANQKCIIAASGVSNTITMHVTTAVAPTVTISSSGNSICPGDQVTFTALAQNAGANPSYQWVVNGSNTGSNSASFQNANLKNGDNIYCLLTGDNPNCPSSTPSSSNTEIINVKPVPVINTAFTDTTILPQQQLQLKATISGNIQSYDWSPPNLFVNAALPEPITIPLINNTVFQLTATEQSGCKASSLIRVYVFYKLYMPSAFTPNGDGHNDFFRIPPGVSITIKEFSVFNRWGDRIFTTTDRNAAWDGTVNGRPADTGSYVYIISGNTINGKITTKGIVTLVR